MLTYEITCDCTYPTLAVTMTVYANTKSDATKIAEAYLLTLGYRSAEARFNYKMFGAAPAGAKVGVQPRMRRAGSDEMADDQKAEDYLKNLDFGELEQRVLAYAEGKLGNLYADMASTVGVTREEMKAAFYKHVHTPTGRLWNAPCHWSQGTYHVTASAVGEAEALKEEAGNRRQWAAPQPNDKPYERSEFKNGRGYINLYPRGDGSVQAGNVYTTREGAQAAAKYPESVTTAHIYWVPPVPRVSRDESGWPHNFNNLTPGQMTHLNHRLRAWAGLPDQNAQIKVYATTQVPGAFVNITVGSPQWRECLGALRAWLSSQGLEVRNRRGTTTVLEVKWADLAPRVWPL